MKILGIVGSLRADSLNRKSLHAFGEVLPAGVELVVAELHEIPMYNADVQAKGFPSSVEELAAKVRSADALVFATPEYNYSVPGVLKNAIDWLSRLPDQPLSGKPAGIIGASPGKIGTARAQYHLRQIGVFVNLLFLNRPEVMIGEATAKFDDSGRLTDDATREFLRRLAEALVEHARRFGGK